MEGAFIVVQCHASSWKVIVVSQIHQQIFMYLVFSACQA